MPTTPISDLSQQGLFELTRTLLQQSDLTAVSETLSHLVRQAGLADRAAMLFLQQGFQTLEIYSSTLADADKLALEQGPMRRLLSRPDTLNGDYAAFCETWPGLNDHPHYAEFARYGLLPLTTEGHIFGGFAHQFVDIQPLSRRRNPVAQPERSGGERHA